MTRTLRRSRVIPAAREMTLPPPKEHHAPRRAGLGPSLQRLVRNEVRGAGLQDKTLVVAVSGGPDSLALLHLLARLRASCGLTLHVAHLDHALREGSAADARFVQEQARLLDLPFTCRREDVHAYRARRKLGMEQAAREVRYAFLAQVASAAGAAAVALGHTADDQAETVLHHIIRGTGLRGLQGMERLSTLPTAQGAPVTLFRPLLSVTREETEGLCRSLGLTPRTDPTNVETSHTRNFIRSRVLPLLHEVNPRVRESLLRLSRTAALETADLESRASALWPSLASQAPGVVKLDRPALLRQDPAVRRELFRKAYFTLTGTAEGLEERHLEAMEHTLRGPSGRRVSLPHDLTWSVGYEHAALTLLPGGPPVSLPPLEGTWPLACPGQTATGPWNVRATIVSPKLSAHDPYVAVLDAGAVDAELVVRGWRPGDRFQPLGVEESTDKRLKEFFSDAKLPRELRHRVPLVVAPRGIVWVVGWRIAHWARLTSRSTRGLRLEFRLRDES